MQTKQVIFNKKKLKLKIYVENFEKDLDTKKLIFQENF